MSADTPPDALDRKTTDPAQPLLDVRNLQTVFHTFEGDVQAVDRVSFRLKPGETIGVVGESGSGKSITGLSIMRLVQDPPGRIVGGEVFYKGRDLLKLPAREMRKLRGSEISMVFQDPMTSLNPVLSISRQIGESIRLHTGVSQSKAHERVVELLELVGIPDARERANQYPHQFSGGMRQRVMIALALACDPELVIADEPTTALDVTIQAQILDLLRRIQAERHMGLILITHSMGVVAGIADRVQVMYAGRAVETAPTRQLFAAPRHPYTVGLLRSIPRLGSRAKGKLHPIRGLPPNFIDLPDMCAFAPRCDMARKKCFAKRPPLAVVGEERASACWFWDEVKPFEDAPAAPACAAKEPASR